MLYASDYDSETVSVASKNQPYSNKLPRIPIKIATSLVNATSIQSLQAHKVGIWEPMHVWWDRQC